jgi:hypothetical protein
VTGAVVPYGDPGVDNLRRTAHEFIGTLFSKIGTAFTEDARVPAQGPLGAGAGDTPLESGLLDLATRVCPVTAAAVPLPGSTKDPLRRQAHELVEALLSTFGSGMGPSVAATSVGTKARIPPVESQVPLLRCAAPVQSGHEAYATIRIANEEGTPSDVSLYCSNFVTDSGYEIPSLRVTVSPRRVTIAPNGEASFEIKIAVSPQTPAGIYSGLIQAMGSKYVKAVLCVEVR